MQYDAMRCDTIRYFEHEQVFLDRYAFDKFVLPRYNAIYVSTEELPNLDKTTYTTDDA